MKKIWVILISAIVLLAVLLTVLLLIGRKKQTTEDTECKYEYFYRITGKNITVTVRGGEEGYRWNASSSAPEAVTAIRKSEKKNTTVFVLTPVEDGGSVVRLVLERENQFTDRLYEIALTVSVRDGSASVLGGTHAAYEGMTVFGEGTAHPYVLADETEGRVTLIVRGTGEDRWTPLVSTDRVVAVEKVAAFSAGEDPDGFGGQIRFLLLPLSKGQAEVRVCDVEQNVALLLLVTVDDDFNLTVTDSRFEDYTFAEPTEDPKKNSESVIGTVRLPAGAEAAGANSMTLMAPDGSVRVAGWVEFKLDGISWRYFAVPDADAAVFTATFVCDANGKSTVTVGDRPGVAYLTEDGTAVVLWDNAEGDAFCVAAETDPAEPAQHSDTATAAAVAGQMFAANPTLTVK